MEQKKKKTVWQQYVGMAFFVLIGAACGIVMVSCIDGSEADTPLYQDILTIVAQLIGMYVAFFFHMMVHEAGHLVFGLMTGYKFSSYRIGSFMWLNEDGRLRFKRLTLAGTGGQCLMTPPDIKDGKLPFVLYNLGGSFVNMALGAIFLAAYLLCPDIKLISPGLLIFAVIGFATAVMNGVPMRMGTVDNDGYNTLAMSKDKASLEAFWLQLKVNELSARGVRLKDMPAEWFAVPSDEAMKNSMVAARGVLACSRLMDEACFEQADVLMAHLLEIESGIVGLHRHLMICDRIYVELLGAHRGDVVESMLTAEQKKFMKAMKRFPSVLRTQYVLALLAERDAAKAEAIMGEFEKIEKVYPYRQELDSEKELMRLAEQKALVSEGEK